MTEKHPCAYKVWHPIGTWGHSMPCKNNGTYQEPAKYGHDPDELLWWCGTHAPSRVQARRDASYQKFEAEWKAKQDARNYQDCVLSAQKAVVAAARELLHTPLREADWNVSVAAVMREAEKLEQLEMRGVLDGEGTLTLSIRE